MSLRRLELENGHARFMSRGVAMVVISWEAAKPIDIDIRLVVADGRFSGWLPYMRALPWRSCSPTCEFATIAVDSISAELPIVAVDVRAPAARIIYAAVPPTFAVSSLARALTRVAVPVALPVPTKSQYVGTERGWCSAASLAMLLGYWAQQRSERSWDLDVATVAEHIYDASYLGTGNWTFATAFAAGLGLHAAVTFFPDLNAAYQLIAAGLPLALAIAWEEGELPNAPLERSAGHVLVVRGFDRAGNVLVNDPAHPEIAVTYERAAFEKVWLRAGGVAYVLAPSDMYATLIGVCA